VSAEGDQVRLTREDVLRHISQRRPLRGLDLSGIDLSHCRLLGADFESADLSEANLTGADLSGSSLVGANLSGLDLTGATLVGVNVDLASLHRTRLHRADLRRVDFSAARIVQCEFRAANLFKSKFQNQDLTTCSFPQVNLGSATLVGCNLQGVNLRGAQLVHALLRHANLESTDLSMALFKETRLESCVLLRTSFLQAQFIEFDFRDIELDGCDFTEAILRGARFSESALRACTFERANLSRVALEGLDLRKICFRGVDLERANLTGANLSEAVLEGANVDGASFADALLGKANLRKVRGKGTSFRAARLDESDLSGSELDHASFFGAEIHRSSLVDVCWSSVNLSAANLRQCSLLRAVLVDGTFAKATIESCQISESSFERSSFDGATLDRSSFDRVDFGRALFEDMRVVAQTFTRVKLSRASLCGVTLRNTRWVDSEFDGVDCRSTTIVESSFENCKWIGARFLEGRIEGARFPGTTLRDSTFETSELIRCDFAGIASADLSTCRGLELPNPSPGDARVEETTQSRSSATPRAISVIGCEPGESESGARVRRFGGEWSDVDEAPSLLEVAFAAPNETFVIGSPRKTPSERRAVAAAERTESLRAEVDPRAPSSECESTVVALSAAAPAETANDHGPRGVRAGPTLGRSAPTSSASKTAVFGAKDLESAGVTKLGRLPGWGDSEESAPRPIPTSSSADRTLVKDGGPTCELRVGFTALNPPVTEIIRFLIGLESLYIAIVREARGSTGAEPIAPEDRLWAGSLHIDGRCDTLFRGAFVPANVSTSRLAVDTLSVLRKVVDAARDHDHVNSGDRSETPESRHRVECVGNPAMERVLLASFPTISPDRIAEIAALADEFANGVFGQRGFLGPHWDNST
jgi:uncharacterized protein YjbI with pentapeptide repeats